MDAFWLIALVLFGKWKIIQASCNGTYTVGQNKLKQTKPITVNFQQAFCEVPTQIEATVVGSSEYADTFAAAITSITSCGFKANVTRLDEVKTWWQTQVNLAWKARFDPQTSPSPFPTGSTGCHITQENCVEGILCEAKIRGCADAATWDGSACVCRSGFETSGPECVDVNECESPFDVCQPHSTCTNSVGSYACQCDTGFRLIGEECTEVNECVEEIDGCHANATCTNTVGHYTCRCKVGFTGNGIHCEDINECLETVRPCHQRATCANVPGSYSCACESGFRGNGSFCQDINECLEKADDCHSNASCLNGVGKFSCRCKTGFQGTGKICKDVDECALQTHGCHTNATCTNYNGGHECFCNAGFSGDGMSCEDVNECLLQTHGCHKNATCRNYHGGHECFCKKGFSGDGQNCQDLDECSLQTHRCHDNATCKNYDGGYSCFCKNGYTGNGKSCEDINECMEERHDCHTNATCKNYNGGHACFCNDGFIGDGMNCHDVNECSLQTHECHKNATCQNYHGGYACICNDGFTGNGTNCKDKNECELKTHDCHKNATCINNVPGYSCTCNQGFHGDGTNCTGYCDPIVLEDFSFDSAYVGERQPSNERCPGGKPATTALCVDKSPKRAYFILTPFNGCGMDLAEITKMAKSTEDFAIASKHVASLVSGSSNLTEAQVNNVVNFLQDITLMAENGSINVSTNTFSSMLSVVNSLVENQWNSSESGEMTANDIQNQQDVVKSISSMALVVQLNKSDPIFNYQSNSFTIEVKEDESSDFPKVTFSANSAIDVVLPPSAVRSAWAPSGGSNDSARRSAFVYYKDDSLFYSENGVHSVISVDVGNAENLQNLTEPVVIKFLDQHARFSETPAIKTSAKCVYWDFNTSSWLSDGCCLNTTSDPPECLCYHLTNFALIVKSETVPTDAALTIVSYVGCVASICGLLLTIALHLWLREIRRRRPVKILVNICANLVIADIVFLAGVTRSEHPIVCTVVTAILHYFLLTTWCWMTVYSYDMYMSVVKVFRNDAGHFMRRVSAFAYLTPAAIALLTVSIAVGHFDQIPQESGSCNAESNPFQTSVYRAENMCWLKEYSLYFGFLLPVGILATFNLFCFALIFREIVCKKMEGRTRAMKRTNTQNLLIAFTMAAVMGMTWIFGYFMLISEDVTYLRIMSWLFAVVNSAQGVSIFILTTLRSQELRRVWWNPLRVCCGQASSSTSRFMSTMSFKTSVGSFRHQNGHGNTTFTEASNDRREHSSCNNFHSTSINNGS